MRANNKNLVRVMRLTKEMLALADEGDRDRDDDPCGIIYGILRDAAYQLRNLTAIECQKHRDKNKWDGPDSLESLAPGNGWGDHG